MSETKKTLRATVREIREACKQEGSIVKEVQMDEYLQLTLGEGDDEEMITVILPENYPRGVYKVLDRKGMREVGRGELKKIVDAVIVMFAKDHNMKPVPRLWSEEDEEPADLARQMSTLSAEDDGGFSSAASVNAKPIIEAIDAVRAMFGPQSCGVMIPGSADHVLRFRFDTSFADEDMCNMWGVHHGIPVIVEFKLIAPHYLNTSRRPETDIYQCATTDLSLNLTAEKLKFTLSWQLEQRLKEFMKWPLEGAPKDVFCKVYGHLQNKLQRCTEFCIICDKQLDYVGLKPAVCDSALCCYSYMQYGLGEDIALFLHRNPEVVDLLICLTAAAANGDVKRFNPFPAGVEARFFDERKKEVVTMGFMKGPTLQEKDVARVLEVVNRIPPVKEMVQYKTSPDLKEALDKYDPLCFPLLRWIITSNRTHLEAVPPEIQIASMGTPHQFILRSSTPEKEKLFMGEKEKHGKFYAFHGSAFSNWHCILRVGLKNYSGTDMMSCGAAYGNGIYMATNSGTSFGYAGATTAGWKNSAIVTGSGVGLAICEVVAAGYTANPYYVVPEENHVNTRFFFVYSGHGGVDVVAASLTLPDTTTLKPTSAAAAAKKKAEKGKKK